MKTIEYLKEHGLPKLIAEFSIKAKEYDNGLIVLNYDQIESPKAHPITMECRSLILDREFNVVSRSFDRFFNLGEQPDTQKHIDWSRATCYEKVDGSLIKIYFYDDRWEIATRGTAFAESDAGGFGVTFRELVLRALQVDEFDFQNMANTYLQRDWTYICEVTAMENRVVKVYEGYKLHFLAARNNKTGEYGGARQSDAMYGLGAVPIQRFSFESVEACVMTANKLTDLDEGYVVYQDGVPVCKVKSPAYVAVHHLRGEGLNPKRIMQLVLTGEEEEYLKYFNEDRPHVEPYVRALINLKSDIGEVWERSKNISDQKEFALAVKDYPFSGVLFQTRKSGGKTTDTVFNEQSEPSKMRMLEGALAGGLDNELKEAA